MSCVPCWVLKFEAEKFESSITLSIKTHLVECGGASIHVLWDEIKNYLEKLCLHPKFYNDEVGPSSVQRTCFSHELSKTLKVVRWLCSLCSNWSSWNRLVYEWQKCTFNKAIGTREEKNEIAFKLNFIIVLWYFQRYCPFFVCTYF